jgi:AcrR family transcriptional regulator
MKDAQVPTQSNESRRLSGEERRAQIVEATLRLISRYGVQGTTLHRIASEVGVTHPALYAHFRGRREILLAALDAVFERILAVHRAYQQGNALERLRAISLYHSELVASASDGFVSPLFEFLAAAPEEGLREELASRERTLLRDLAAIVREGQQKGTIRPDVEPEQAAFLITSRHWAEDVLVLMGLADDDYRARSLQVLEQIIRSMEMPSLEA